MNDDATSEHYGPAALGGSFASENVVIFVNSNVPAIDQVIASNVAGADQTDGAARLMIMSDAAAQIAGMNAPLANARDAASAKN